MPDIVFTLIGFCGPLMFLLAYLQLSLGNWNGSTPAVHLLNFGGAVALLISLIRFWNLPMFVMEMSWAAVSLYGLWRARSAR